MDIKQIRKRNLEILIARHKGVRPLADAVGTDPNYLSQLRSPSAKRSVGHRLARQIEKGVKLPDGWMDKEQSLHDPGQTNTGNISAISSTVRNVPLISWVQAGEWNEAVDMYEPGHAEHWEPTAERVGPNAFALRVEGDSMEPEFPAGGFIIVDPSVEPRNGDFVIAKVNGAATFKELVQDAGRAYLKPINPRYQIMELAEGSEIVGVVVSQNKRYR